MELKQILKQHLHEAMKEKDTDRKNVVTLLRAAILQTEKDTKTELDDAGVLAIVAKQLKQRKDSLEAFQKAGREDLIKQTNREIELLSAYMPEQLSDNELEEIVREAIRESGAQSLKELGKAMALAIQKVQGKADGKRVSAMAKKLLEEAK